MTVITPVGTEADERPPDEPTLAEIRELIRRVVVSGALDLDANEELTFALLARNRNDDSDAGAIEVATLAELSAYLAGQCSTQHRVTPWVCSSSACRQTLISKLH